MRGISTTPRALRTRLPARTRGFCQLRKASVISPFSMPLRVSRLKSTRRLR
jgi:hypothetical protein